MKEWGLLSVEGATYLEFGAGKAGLSSFISGHAVKPATFVVNDREARRLKQDKVMREGGFDVQRDTVDIKDYDLSRAGH